MAALRERRLERGLGGQGRGPAEHALAIGLEDGGARVGLEETSQRQRMRRAEWWRRIQGPAGEDGDGPGVLNIDSDAGMIKLLRASEPGQEEEEEEEGESSGCFVSNFG